MVKDFFLSSLSQCSTSKMLSSVPLEMFQMHPNVTRNIGEDVICLQLAQQDLARLCPAAVCVCVCFGGVKYCADSEVIHSLKGIDGCF